MLVLMSYSISTGSAWYTTDTYDTSTSIADMAYCEVLGCIECSRHDIL